MEPVIANLIGGLGNQMFQYATGRAVAHRHGAPLLLDSSGFVHYDLRRYELGKLSIQARLATEDELTHAGVRAKAPTLLSRVSKALGLCHPANLLKEASFTYDTRIEQATPPVYLDGCWQSERYFSTIRAQLLQELTLKNNWVPSNEDMFGQIRAAGAGAVSLHVRRGDYVTNAHTASFHGVCSLDYYRAAVAYIAKRLGAPHFFIFSDDLDWVRQNLQIGFPTTFVAINSADNGIYDLMLMRSCRHHIIANSSFSWWGAWLNPHDDKIVVCPQRWFSGASLDTRDLIPSSWIRL